MRKYVLLQTMAKQRDPLRYGAVALNGELRGTQSSRVPSLAPSTQRATEEYACVQRTFSKASSCKRCCSSFILPESIPCFSEEDGREGVLTLRFELGSARLRTLNETKLSLISHFFFHAVNRVFHVVTAWTLVLNHPLCRLYMKSFVCTFFLVCFRERNQRLSQNKSCESFSQPIASEQVKSDIPEPIALLSTSDRHTDCIHKHQVSFNGAQINVGHRGGHLVCKTN